MVKKKSTAKSSDKQSRAKPAATSSFKVQATTYISQFHLESDGLVWFERFHHYKTANSQTDVFGRYWTLVVLPPGYSVKVSRHGQEIELHGGWAGYIPPFSIIQWHLRPGFLMFSAYMSREPLPPGLPAEPFWFRWLEKQAPSKIQEIFTIFEKAQEKIPIGKEETISAVAAKTKRLLDETFSEDLSMAEVGERLGYSHAVMTRAFKKCYGIPPIEYRNKLRIFESMAVMALSGKNVNSTAAEVGFKDLSRFNKNFRRQISALPSQFRAPWKNQKASES